RCYRDWSSDVCSSDLLLRSAPMTSHDEKHEHSAAHAAPETGPALRVKAIESLLAEKGLIDPRALDAIIDAYEHKIGPRIGARVRSEERRVGREDSRRG